MVSKKRSMKHRDKIARKANKGGDVGANFRSAGYIKDKDGYRLDENGSRIIDKAVPERGKDKAAPPSGKYYRTETGDFVDAKGFPKRGDDYKYCCPPGGTCIDLGKKILIIVIQMTLL